MANNLGHEEEIKSNQTNMYFYMCNIVIPFLIKLSNHKALYSALSPHKAFFRWDLEAVNELVHTKCLELVEPRDSIR